MSSLTGKVVEWQRLYEQWCSTELELREARTRCPASSSTVCRLTREVERLQERCSHALDEAEAVLAAERLRRAGFERESLARPAAMPDLLG